MHFNLFKESDHGNLLEFNPDTHPKNLDHELVKIFKKDLAYPICFSSFSLTD